MNKKETAIDPADSINLSGTWRNQLGSTMILQQSGSKIIGRYHTSVESEPGKAAMSSDISGMVQPVTGGNLVGFNVLWNHGESISTWVGQCMECGGQEKLYTTWVLRSLKDPEERWMCTRVNQDTFWRIDDESLEAAKDASENVPTSDVRGEWKSVTGDSIVISKTSEEGSYEGWHKTEGTQSFDSLLGRFDGDETYTAFGFIAANDQYIRGWSGYVHNPQDTNQLMETSWLCHKFSNLCNDPRKYVEYGMDNYSKESSSAE